jgi:twitching motility protein PilT
MIGIPSVANLIREGKTFQIPSIMQTAKKHGMVLMNDSLGELVRKGLVEPQEAYAKASDKPGLLNQLKKLNIDTSWAQAEAAPGG